MTSRVAVPVKASALYTSLQTKRVLQFTRAVAQKFIDKVENGTAHSVETYRDMQEVVRAIDALQL